MTTACPNCDAPIADPLAVIETDGACPACGKPRDELFDIALDTEPERSAAETIVDNYAPEAEP